jgi:hypothetical protein
MEAFYLLTRAALTGWMQDRSPGRVESVFRIVNDPFRGAIEEPIKTVLAELPPIEDFP